MFVLIVNKKKPTDITQLGCPNRVVYTNTRRGSNNTSEQQEHDTSAKPRGVLPYMGYTGMCHCEGYGFQAVYSRIRYMNQSVWV